MGWGVGLEIVFVNRPRRNVSKLLLDINQALMFLLAISMNCLLFCVALQRAHNDEVHVISTRL